MSHPLEEYAMLADGRSAALVHLSGSIDWLCWPRFDSRAIFTRLLGGDENGFWKINPLGNYRATRRYDGPSLVLQTDFTTSEGRTRLTDWLSLSASTPVLFRKIEGLEGSVRMRMALSPRFDFGSIDPWITEGPHGQFFFVAGPDGVELRSSLSVTREGSVVGCDFTIQQGQVEEFTLLWTGTESLPFKLQTDLKRDLAYALDDWREWAERCEYVGEHRDLVLRSLLTLKGLIYRPSGGIVAAPTTSLPEDIGGVRNWDYRYCWIRDATYTLYAFLNAGYTDEARAWRQWLARSVAGSPSQMNIMYGIQGERRLPELTLDWLAGYENSHPVRTGNAAYTQRQFDIFGEMMDVFHLARRKGIEPDDTTWAIQRDVIDYLEHEWRNADEGIWETRGPHKHFTHSKVMAWVALDRAIKATETFHLPGDGNRWREVREAIHADICRHGFNPRLNSFTQSYGSTNVDASLLMIPLVGFLPAHDPRVIGTIRMIEKTLFHDGFVRRYLSEETNDGLPGSDSTFLACSYWLVDNYLLQGEQEKAARLFNSLASLANDVGLLSEEYDIERKRLVGNFPQALTHISLVNSAFNLAGARSPAKDRPLKFRGG